MRYVAALVASSLLLLAVACGSEARKRENDARALRAAMPSVAAYWADHNTYSGINLAQLRQYDASMEDISIVRLNKKTYCIETGAGNPHLFFDTENFELMLGSCSEPKKGTPYNPPQTNEAADESNTTDASYPLRNAAPAIEAYHEDNNTYAGMTIAKLRRYDASIKGISIVRMDKEAYCIESIENVPSVFFEGPSGEIMLGSCSDPGTGKPYNSPAPEEASSPSEPLDPFSALRASIPAIEAYYQDHNGYSGMTVSILREKIDQGLPAITIVSAKKNTYCIEIAVDGVSAFTKGPVGDFEQGHCPA